MTLRMIAAGALLFGTWLASAAAQEIMSAEEIAFKLSLHKGIQLDTVVGLPTAQQLDQPERPRVNLDTIRFEFNSADLTSLAKRQLDEVGRALNMGNLGATRFMMGGHTDAVGGDAYNQALSERRANAAVDYLVNNFGIDRARLVAIGWGERRLLYPADPEDDANRRVEISNLGMPN